MKSPKKSKKTTKSEWKKSFKELLSGIASYMAGVGIIAGIALVFFGIVWAISLLFNSNNTEEPPIRYEKSAEQKKYEQECIKVNVAIQEEPDTEFKIESDLVAAYCGCLGEQLFPKGSERIVYSEEDGFMSKMNIRHTCKNSIFRGKDDYYGNAKFSDNYGDKKFIQERLQVSLQDGIGFFYRKYGHNISINVPCVLDAVYDDDNPLYYYESLWLENKIRSAIRAYFAYPDLDKFLNYWFN